MNWLLHNQRNSQTNNRGQKYFITVSFHEGLHVTRTKKSYRYAVSGKKIDIDNQIGRGIEKERVKRIGVYVVQREKDRKNKILIVFLAQIQTGPFLPELYRTSFTVGWRERENITIIGHYWQTQCKITVFFAQQRPERNRHQHKE